MLYYPVHRPFWRRHPLLVGAAVAIVCWQLINGAYTLVAVELAVALFIYVRRHRHATALRDSGLRARADFEHRLALSGDPRGTYGRYPPVQPGWFADPRNPWMLRYFDGVAWTGFIARR
jgi:hypothetical protein